MKLRGLWLHLAGVAAVAAVAAMYTSTELIMMLANMLWACFG